jgi:hypothetical protein
MFPLNLRIRIAMGFALLISAHVVTMAQQTQPRTLYSVYNNSRTCMAEDGQSYVFLFVTNIFTTSSAKFHNNLESQAQQAFDAMIAAEGWDCHNYGNSVGNGIGQLIQSDSQATAQWYRDGMIRQGKSSGFGIVEYIYFDGAASGSAPQTTVEPQ